MQRPLGSVPARSGRPRLLPPFLTEVDQRRRDALLDIGKRGGLLDARDNLDAGPILLITDPAPGTPWRRRADGRQTSRSGAVVDLRARTVRSANAMTAVNVRALLNSSQRCRTSE
jgi:hypothetical protein